MELKLMYKIKFKSPTVEEQILFFTATEYVIEDGLITFTDKFGKTQTWNTTFLINIEKVLE
jgi:hypothetical protein